MQDDTVSDCSPIDAVKSVVGIDVGLKEFLVTSEGVAVPIQQTYRKAKGRLASCQKKCARKVKGSAKLGCTRCSTFSV